MNLFKKMNGIYNSKFKNSGEFERFEYKFDENDSLSSIWCAHYVIYSKFLEHAENIPTLDLCCGVGPGTILISKKLNVPVTGIDYSKKAIDYAEKNNLNKDIEYFCLDLHNNLQRIQELILLKKIKQVFFVEGIEHIKNDYDLIDMLLHSGIKKIFISTPNESEKTEVARFHINPITPIKLNGLKQKYEIEFLQFCKFIIPKTLTKENYLDEAFTDNPKEGLNYLFIVKGFRHN